MKVLLTAADFGLGYELTPINKRLLRRLVKATRSESVLFQTDWDFPGLARSLGWNMAATKKCSHRSTDGTVTCHECGKTASYFIARAQEYLDKRCGSILRPRGIEDYFREYFRFE